jgi:glycosyltransferase involved in cell wall biosynthesis
MPAHNAGLCIGRAINSVLQQTHKPWEVIIINDGSTDDTEVVVKKYGCAIRYSSQANRGPASARNAGLRMATGDYIAFLDADDYWAPDFLFRCVQALLGCPQAVAATSGTCAIGPNGVPRITPFHLTTWDIGNTPRIPILLSDFFSFWALHRHICVGSVVARRAISNQICGMREDLRMLEDWEYWALLGTHGPWVLVPDVLFVSDGGAVAAKQGWLTKNRIRWRTCPSVEDWVRRIEPRLLPQHQIGFEIILGHVAWMITISAIWGSKDWLAKRTVEQFGFKFPNFALSHMTRRFSRHPVGWKAWCAFLRWREQFRHFVLLVRHRFGRNRLVHQYPAPTCSER